MTHPLHTIHAAVAARTLVAGLLVVTLAACGGSDAASSPTAPTSVSTTEPAAPTVAETIAVSTASTSRVLSVAHIDASGGLDPATEWFADALEDRSNGSLTAEFRFECCGRQADVEQTLLEAVRSADADLGWVGVRAFAQAGTTAFEPLIAPLLVRSYAAEQAIVESDVANGLLAQLEPLGLVGLGLVPGHLRYPMSTGASLATPADWLGQPIYVFESQIGSAAVAALGADPQHLGFDERDQGLAEGSIAGLDNTIGFQADRLDVFTHLVADVPMTTRMSALVASPVVELSDDERRWIAEAVADVAARTEDLGEIDRRAAADACTFGNPGYAVAGSEAVAAFESALEPVEAGLAADPAVAATLEALHELVDEIPPEPPVACENVDELQDTSHVTLRTLIDAPAERPSLSNAGDHDSGTTDVTYVSGGLTIAGRLSLPNGSGPFPAVVLVQPFGGLERAAGRLVDAGYVVLDLDARGQGRSDPDPSRGTDLEMGATLDAVNAARALGGDPRVDSTRIALVGAGLGGLIAINAQVVAPDVVDAVVATNPSGTDVWRNVEFYLEPDNEMRRRIVESRGTPEENRSLWADLSPATFVDRVDSPLLILQGTGETFNEPSWSHETVALYRSAGKSAQLVTLEGANFELDPSWEGAISAVEAFLATSL
jgi:TRAP-type C4-dicarboxylate transport system substrate-binding protein/pimeloyl-ACP methyl ester carboxylesterase